jgi:hypothetical protein
MFAFASVLISILLFVFLVWPRPSIQAGNFGKWGAVPTQSFTVVHAPVRIGPRGIEGVDTNDPGEFTSRETGWTAVKSSEQYPICVINNIYNSGPVGSCELHHDSESAPWKIQVTGLMSCRVSCFKID